MNNINYMKFVQLRGGGTLGSSCKGFRDLAGIKLNHTGFTLAEMMVVMLILSIIMAAMAPVMTTRNKIDQSSPWQWAPNGTDAYYGIGSSQIAMIGQNTAAADDGNSRLVINAPENYTHILFKQNNNISGRLFFNGSNQSMYLGTTRSNLPPEQRAVSFGIVNSPTGLASLALGLVSTSSGELSIAEGYGATASGKGSLAIGYLPKASGEGAIAIGSNNQANSNYSISAGFNNTIAPLASDSVILGRNNSIGQSNSIVLGTNWVSGGAGGIGIGNKINDDSQIGQLSIGIGTETVVPNANSIAIGSYPQANASSSVAIGYSPISQHANSIAIGSSAQAGSSSNSTAGAEIAIGQSSQAYGADSVAIGHNAKTNDNSDSGTMFAIAIGNDVAANGNDSISIGVHSRTNNGYSVAIGSSAIANGQNSTAIGRGACTAVTGSNKTCIGANSGNASSYGTWYTDDEERIFIGSQSKFNDGPAVLEVHNSNARDGILGRGDMHSSVVINGTLIVKGGIITTLPSVRSDNNTLKLDGTGQIGILGFRQQTDGTSYVTYGYTTGQNYSKYSINGSFKLPTSTGWRDAAPMQSDRRLKYVGKASTSGLDKIRQLKVFNYTFKKDEKKTPHVGVIAQDLQKVFPDAVKKGVDGFLTIRFEDMFFAMINAIKELDSRITSLEKENQELKTRLKQLENNNKMQENRLKALEEKIK